VNVRFKENSKPNCFSMSRYIYRWR